LNNKLTVSPEKHYFETGTSIANTFKTTNDDKLLTLVYSICSVLAIGHYRIIALSYHLADFTPF
jgi:hypothetical protein